MSISDGLYNLADVRIAALNGVHGIGFNRLMFSLELAVNATKGRTASISEPRCFAFASTSRSGQFLPLGSATPETTWFTRTSDYSNRDGFTVYLDLSSEQLAALENMRSGHPLVFRLDLHFIVNGEHGLQRSFEQCFFDANPSIWSKVLKDLGQYDQLLLGIDLPVGKLPKKFATAISYVHAAQADLIAGRYDSVVRNVRLCMEGLEKNLTVDPVGNRAIGNFSTKEGRERMTKRERSNLVRASIRHYAHLAHHLDSDGNSEHFSRHDATFILAAAAATVWDAIGKRTQPNKKA